MAFKQGTATRVAPDIWTIDTMFLGEPGVIASYLLTGPHGNALVDVGSGASVEQLLSGIRAAGVDPVTIEHLLLTHIHLDHAGAAGILVEKLPHARVYVHAVGAPHLIDPSRLLSSAERIYGDRMAEMWGTMEPVPADRLTVINEGDVLRAGEREVQVLYTPGHAIHHVAFHDSAHAEIFSGDVAGVHLEGVDFVRPPTPPPDLNLEDWYASIDRLQALRPQRLYLPHFGPAAHADQILRSCREMLAAWGELMLTGMRAGETEGELARDLANHFDSVIARAATRDAEEAVQRYELATNYLMSAQGYVRYFRKHHPELLA